MYWVPPPMTLRPTTRFAYCTLILRCAWVTQMTAAMTRTRKAIISTSTIGFTWLPCPPLGTKVRHAWMSAAGRRAAMPTEMISDMPLPMPRSVI